MDLTALCGRTIPICPPYCFTAVFLSNVRTAYSHSFLRHSHELMQTITRWFVFFWICRLIDGRQYMPVYVCVLFQHTDITCSRVSASFTCIIYSNVILFRFQTGHDSDCVTSYMYFEADYRQLLFSMWHNYGLSHCCPFF